MDDAARGARRDDDYGMTDPAAARRWGYTLDWHRDTTIPWEAGLAPGTRLFTAVNGRDTDGRPVETAGVPSGGCLASARHRLGMDQTTELVTGLERQAWTTSRERPEVTAAAGRWRICIEQAGYSYDNPVEAPYAYWSRQRMRANPHPTEIQRRTGIAPTSAEIAAAVADVGCKRTSGFLRAWIGADLTAQQDLVERNRDRLDQLRQTLDRALAVAAKS